MEASDKPITRRIHLELTVEEAKELLGELRVASALATDPVPKIDELASRMTAILP